MPSTDHLFAQAILRADKRKRRDRIADWIATLLASLVLILLGGWELMLAVGIARAEWLPNLPTIGYGPAVLLVGLLRVAFSKPKSPKES